jgi:copper(I)-binding protein
MKPSPTAMLAALLFMFIAAPQVDAADAPARNIEVISPWARATPPVAKMGAAYLEIRARAADTLVSATSPVAERIEIHATVENNGVLQMRPLDSIPVAPGKPAMLAPGGTHIMLVGLRAPLATGTSFPLTLKFKQAGEVTVQVSVLKDAPAAHHAH